MKKFLIAAPLALAAGAVLATPASAATLHAGQIRSEIAQLDRQVDRANGLSRAESVRLERQVDQLQSLYQRYARRGFNRDELQTLNARIGSVKAALHTTSRDRDNRGGRTDRNGHNDRDDHGTDRDGRGQDRHDGARR
ncbi:MAG TPA: hypothetical protein VEB68_14565 [Croceibacterium sp.]|nr:hypothetical protein [Croceibacterium sp.]